MEYDRSMSTSKPVLQKRLWALRLSERQALLLVVDFLVALIALGVSLYLWGSSERFTTFPTFLQKRVPIWFYGLPVIWLLLMVEQYDIHRASNWRKTVRGIAFAAMIGLVVYLFFFFYYFNPQFSPASPGNSQFSGDRFGVHSYLAVNLYPHIHRAAVYAPHLIGRRRQ
jgi:hypothetical protein